eukprot:CAMPEP_0170605908 /NCGR_PEP_ID=MMETSP0224-20130122/20221_1 /TAXON_ID=285029 /ORGANISM="Togula jolla, Strain CCCM 725" /LENGTH=733 /DNA_ID=CAMNT_0010930937 /DNA_START=49 /DNA_END=2250 /DNA_ORIENTATION=+
MERAATYSAGLVLALLALGHFGVAATHARGASALMVGASESKAAEHGVGPVARVVSLLEEMQTTLQKEMKEDEALFDKLSCWCHNNEYEKDEAASSAEAKIGELQSSIESLTAKSGELKSQISELEAGVKADKGALAEATAQREKELKEFNGGEHDSIQNIENLKAAIMILSRHHGSALPQLQQLALLALHSKDEPWTAEHEDSSLSRPLDDFMRRFGFDTPQGHTQKFLQSPAVGASSDAWSAEESAAVRTAIKSASAFVQAKHGESYYPSYSAKSGDILGVLKQLKEEMEGDLSEEQKLENARAAAFSELRAAKTAQIESGEAMAEKKEDDLANTHNALAEAKEDLTQEEASLSETQKFLVNLNATCSDASSNFAERKQMRLEEIAAVSETINILSKDEAKDTMGRTYALLQLASSQDDRSRRARAAQALREAAAKTHSPQLSMLASATELDAFSRVKKAIDDMIAMLKIQQSDEVKKSDYCQAELHSTEMTLTKTDDEKADLEAKEGALAASIKSLEDSIAEGHSQVSELQLNLQRMSEDRLQQNLDFQKTVADQTMVAQVLHTALERLAKYYDDSFLQRGVRTQVVRQTPPVPQMEYAPSKGASGVMQMIEKLIKESQEMRAESTKAEAEAQVAYETLVADTNGSIAALQKEVVTQTKVKAETTKDKLQTEADIVAAVQELDGLSKYTAQLHGECDYLLKNFGARQEARAQEMEALQQAKQILSGASLG